MEAQQQQQQLQEGRARLDATLLSPTFAERSKVLKLVQDQLSRSPLLDDHARKNEKIDLAAQKRAMDVWELLEGLRSARQELFDNCEETPSSWKIKQETENMRVMYRPGPEGTPYHTYCVEGLIQGPMVNAACVAWEVPSHHNWWPQFTVPTFKILESRWLKRIRVGEDLALVRVKVPWPLAQREALLTQFELEHFEDDILLFFLGTAPSDPAEVEEELQGFSGNDIPPLKPDAVRIDTQGGFVMQRITSELNFFRIIVHMDIKVDFVPPSIINFITRQLAGSGYKLFQKAVLAASKSSGSGKVYQSLINREPMYTRLRTRMEEMLDARTMDGLRIQQDLLRTELQEVEVGLHEHDIVEEEQVLALENGDQTSGARNRAEKKRGKPQVGIDPEVVWALDVLDRMINYVHELKDQAAPCDEQESIGFVRDSTMVGSSSNVVPNGYTDTRRDGNGDTRRDGNLRDGQLARRMPSRGFKFWRTKKMSN